MRGRPLAEPLVLPRGWPDRAPGAWEGQRWGTSSKDVTSSKGVRESARFFVRAVMVLHVAFSRFSWCLLLNLL